METHVDQTIHQRNQAKPAEAEVMKTWNDFKERFRQAFEDGQGRDMCYAIRQMEDDCEHIERTLVNAHKRKVMLLYHTKYLARMLRKNSVQMKHANKMEESIVATIKAMSLAQNSITHETSVINIGVRSQLQQMQNHFWRKLGIPQSKPNDTKQFTDKSLENASTKRDMPQMEKVRMLLDPANFAAIADKSNGLLLAQHYVINYLKLCSENHPWMQNLRINFPTENGLSETMQLKDVPMFTEDMSALFTGLKPSLEPIKLLEEQFPNGDLRPIGEITELEPIAPFFASEMSDSQKPHPANLFQAIHLDTLANRLKKTRGESDLLSFDEFAAKNSHLFQFIEPPHVSPNRRSTVPWEGKGKLITNSSNFHGQAVSGSNLQIAKSAQEETSTMHPNAAASKSGTALYTKPTSPVTDHQ
ncbi:uncharacterized protein LOC129587914 isoform X2 [Paramacrobiotus metropolitanus]|nr:uncharacterized protein LOC129587914 isoform X2 [Paramacrobiotus metropolitanus]